METSLSNHMITDDSYLESRLWHSLDFDAPSSFSKLDLSDARGYSSECIENLILSSESCSKEKS